MSKPSEDRKVVLITGASGGLGTALSADFRASNWDVIAGYRKTSPPKEERFFPVALDVLNRDDLIRTENFIRERFGNLDALINNAGIIDDELLIKMSEAQFDDVLQTNLKGVFHCCRALGPLLQKRGGHIVNVGSYVARHGAIGQSNYAAAKAGLIGLSLSLAREWGAMNVRVNTIFPGGLKTKMTAHFDSEKWDAFNAANVLGRINTPDEIARFVQFLCTTENISGQVFALDSRITSWG